MSLWLTGGVAVGYATSVIGLHRLGVHRRRQLAAGYPSLRWLDWDTLLADALPAEPVECSVQGPSPVEGGPAPTILCGHDSPERRLLRALVVGQPVQREAFAEAAFSAEQARWLAVLADLRDEPRRTLDALEAASPQTVAQAYLREWLTHEYLASPLTLELRSFRSKRRLNHALLRFGEQPALYFARARASALLGLTQVVLDDLARAVYFSQHRQFYRDAVLAMPFIDEVRPALARACRLEAQRRTGAVE